MLVLAAILLDGTIHLLASSRVAIVTVGARLTGVIGMTLRNVTPFAASNCILLVSTAQC
jgi:hypothetical protein